LTLRSLPPAAIKAMLDDGTELALIDVREELTFSQNHLLWAGAWFAIRSRLDRAIEKIAPAGDVVLTSEDGLLASLAVAEARRFTQRPVHWLKGGNAAWGAAGFPFSTSQKMADEPVDVWLKPYEQTSDAEAAMNAYLLWEVDLLERIKQDGTTRFVHAPRLNSHSH
jgi:rhodanese-related sulfurtransferase